MKHLIIIFLLFIVSFYSCNNRSNVKKNVVQNKIEYNCNQYFNPLYADKFLTEIESRQNENTGSPIFKISKGLINRGPKSKNLKGSVLKINEKLFKLSIRFDEPYEELISETEYMYDKNNKLKSIKGLNSTIEYKQINNVYIQEKITDNSLNYIENVYSADSLLVSSTEKYLFNPDKSQYTLEYRRSDEFKEMKEQFYNKDYSKASVYKKNFFYDSLNRLIKTIYKQPYSSYTYSSYSDSTVIKYKYNDNKMTEAILYNEMGKPISWSRPWYDKKKNILELINISHWILSDDKESEIIYYFDENCNLKKITSVKIRNGIKECDKYILSENGIILETISFDLKTKKEYPDFEYYEDDEKYILEKGLQLETKWMHYYYDEPTLEFDEQGNWISSKDKTYITRREITYQ